MRLDTSTGSTVAADGRLAQHVVDVGLNGLRELQGALDDIIKAMVQIKDDWGKDEIQNGPYGLKEAVESLFSQCKELSALQPTTYDHRPCGQLAIWEVVHTVVDRCLMEAANPLKKYLNHWLNCDGEQQTANPRSLILQVVKGYEDMVHKLGNNTDLLRVLGKVLDLDKRILHIAKEYDMNRACESKDGWDRLTTIEIDAYNAAMHLKADADRLRVRRPQNNPVVGAVIKTAEKVHEFWCSRPVNRYFTERAPGNNHYIGQKNHLDEISRAFLQTGLPPSAQKRFVIHGLPGSGKSEMALRYATEHRREFWGVFWVDASSETNVTQSYIEMAKAFGFKDSTMPAAKEHLSAQHPVHPWLLIIDNADDENLSLDLLAPPGENGFVLVTTRNPEKIDLDNAGPKRHVSLSSMHEDDAHDLLLAASAVKREAQGKRVLKEVANICKSLHYLPLALVHAGKAIRHHALKMREYMVYFKKEADIIRERWRQRRLHQNVNPQSGSLDAQALDDNDKMSVFASFELLTFSPLNQLNKPGDERFADAIELLQIFSFLDPQNIRVDFLLEAAVNPIREVVERNESQKKETEILQRLGLRSHVSWAQAVQRVIQATASLSDSPPLLPEALKNPANLNMKDLKNQVEYRLRKALRFLASRSLITRAKIDYRLVKNEMGNKGDSDEEDEEDSIDAYYMHPLVHQWVRERPSLSAAKQALFCQYALGILSNSVRLVGGNEDVDVAFRMALKPHIEKASEFAKIIEDRISENLERGQNDWWFIRWARRIAQPSSGLSQSRLQVSQNARFGKVFLECGAYKEAQDRLSTVHDYLIQRLGPDHQLAHLAKLGLAKALLFQTRRKASTELLRQVYSSRRKTLGEKHPQTLDITIELAESVLLLGRITESFEFCNQALAGLNQAYGVNHRKTIHCINLIGSVYFFYNDFEASLSQHREAMRLVRENIEEGIEAVPEQEQLVYQENLASTLMTVARSKPEAEREEYLMEADQLSENVVARRETIFGRRHPLTLYGRAQRGRILAARWRQDQKRLSEISEMMFDTLNIAQENLGDSHLGVLAGKKWYAEVLILQDRLDEAEKYLHAACDKDKYAEASDIDGEHPDRIWHVWELVQLLERKGRLDEAFKLCRELEANIKIVGGHGLGPNHRFNKRLLQKIEALEIRLKEESVSMFTSAIPAGTSTASADV
ncbi:hypothetical protein KHU50_004760 [Colletotrichum sp. SAR 10_65]|nr:hypothetical protein KHU50_004760 [Colletotrichum sp. SAR 10_65]KAI8177798.1 hypothetical protein K4K51_005151 [Colletotrichum sp. SAR 10_75]